MMNIRIAGHDGLIFFLIIDFVECTVFVSALLYQIAIAVNPVIRCRIYRPAIFQDYE
jgi:hypothetical protein